VAIELATSLAPMEKARAKPITAAIINIGSPPLGAYYIMFFSVVCVGYDIIRVV
jgi:hypothetical protein